MRPEESRLVGWLLLHSFFIGIPRVLTSTAAMALFLAHFAASDLPLVYIAAAGAVPLVGFVRLRLATWLSLSRLVAVDLSFVVLALVLLRIGLGVSWSAPIFFLLPIWYEVEWVVLSLEFGALAGSLLDVRQGKRLFGLVGSGELVAGCLAGAVSPLLVAVLGTANLLLVSAGAVLCSTFVVKALGPVDTSATAVSGAKPRRRLSSPRGLARRRYLLLLFALVTLSYLGYYVVDNVFYILARRVIPEADRLASYLGVFWGVVSFGTLITRSLVVGRLLERRGLLASLLALPAAVALGVTLVALGGAMGGAAMIVAGLMALTRMLDQVLRDSFERNTLLVLYQPLPMRERLRTQTAVEGIVGPVAGGIAGLLLLVLMKGLGTPVAPLLALLLVLVTLWMAIAVSVRHEYTRVLGRALEDRRLVAAPDAFRDPAARALLVRRLRSDRPREVLDCMEILAHVSAPDLLRSLAPLLDHPSAEVRSAAFGHISPACPLPVRETVRRRAHQETDPAARASALRALSAVGDEEDMAWIASQVGAPDRGARRAALVALARNGSAAGMLTVGAALQQDVASRDPNIRAWAAETVGESRVRALDRFLLPLMSDSVAEVRRSAILAAGAISSEALWPRVVRALGEPADREAALMALGRAGESALPVLAASLAAPGREVSPRVLRRLARICGKVPGPGAVALLWRLVRDAPRDLRRVALTALAARDEGILGDRIGAVRQCLAREAREAARTTADQIVFDAAPAHDLMGRALERELEETRDRILALLSLLGLREIVARVRPNLVASSRRARAQAVELVDSMLPRDLRSLCVPILDDLSPAERHARLSAIAEPAAVEQVESRLVDIVGDAQRGSWLRACALVACSHMPGVAAREALRRATFGEDALARETASWLQALGDSEYATVPDAGGKRMLSTIEKVLVLRRVSIFGETPDDVLADVAELLEEVEYDAGETIFDKGDMGSALFVIVAGRVRVHAEGRTLRELGEREIFGEMAALDPEPRSASITTLAPTRLFRLDQEPLYDLMADRIEVVRGVIRVLCRRLRTVPS